MKISIEDFLAITGLSLLIGCTWYEYGYIKSGMVLGVLFIIAAILRVK